MDGKDTHIPYYVQVAETLRRRIMTDEYVEGSLIPTVPELQRKYGVSNITIRMALDVLAQDGLLQRKRGIGTFVRKHERDLVVFELAGDFKQLVRSIESLPAELEVLEMKIVPCPRYIHQVLSIEAGVQVFQLKKIRKHNGQPLGFYVHYIDPSLGKKITKKKAEEKTFVDVFQEATGIKLTTLKQRFGSVIADIDLSALLRVRFGLPLFFTENLYLAEEEKPLILTQHYYRADRCFFKTTTNL